MTFKSYICPENPAFLLSADVYEWQNIKVQDVFGNNKNASKSEFKGVPSLAAGTFKIPFLKKHHFGWAILARSNSNLDIAYKNEVFDDVISNFPGQEYFGAEVKEGSQGLNQCLTFSSQQMTIS